MTARGAKRSPASPFDAIPGTPNCCWMATAPETHYSALTGSGKADVAVIGAGIVGLTTAYLLAEAGFSVSLLEARRIGRQVTGRSTAKITTQHSLIYRHLIDTLGLERAQQYANANRCGMEQILGLVRDLGVACDLEPRDAHVFIIDPGRRDDLVAEAEAARRVGLDADVLDSAPLPFRTAGSLRFRDQAQFNPAQYLVGLAEAFEKIGGRVFENTRVVAVEPGERWRLRTNDASLDVAHVVIATNFPIAGPIDYDGRTQPRGHVVMAFRIADQDAIDGMFIGIEEPTHSLRMGRDRDGPLLVALGPTFITGNDADVAERFRELDAWAHAHLPVGAATWRWFNEDYDTPDRVPFAGQPSDDDAGLYVATGFNGWGITNGAAAGMLIADQIRNLRTDWASLYAPARPASEEFNKAEEVKARISGVDDLAPGEGGVIEAGDHKVAVWRDDDGRAHAMSAECPHKGCIVTWNNADRTWDCPCHGSIFESGGAVIHGPAVEPLAPAAIPGAS